MIQNTQPFTVWNFSKPMAVAVWAFETVAAIAFAAAAFNQFK
jgi:hypothetical protein